MKRSTSAVQPVWWLAPRPRPVSPWKYSWKSTQVAPVRIVGVARVVAVAGPAAVGVRQEERAPGGADSSRATSLEVQAAARAGRALDLRSSP